MNNDSGNSKSMDLIVIIIELNVDYWLIKVNSFSFFSSDKKKKLDKLLLVLILFIIVIVGWCLNFIFYPNDNNWTEN